MQRELASSLDLRLLAVGSEGEASRRICAEAGFDYLEHPNVPLNRKWNAGVRWARGFDPDGLVIVGSDDLVSAETFLVYAAKLREGHEFFGLSDLYFFDAPSRMLGHWSGYGDVYAHRVGEPIGCGRCFSRSLLEKTGWTLWPDNSEHDRGLDNVTRDFLAARGVHPDSWPMEALGVRAVDIKGGTNITPFHRYQYSESWVGEPAMEFLGEWLSDQDLRRLVESIQEGERV